MIAQLSKQEDWLHWRKATLTGKQPTPSPDNRPQREPGPPRQHTTIGDNEVRRIVQLYQDGHTINQTATTLGIHRTTVMRHLKQQNVPTRYRIETDTADALEATRLYEEGLSIAATADRLGLTYYAVTKHLDAANIARRRSGRTERSSRTLKPE